MQEIEHQIRLLAFSDSNREVLRSWKQFSVPSDGERFGDILKRLDTAEKATRRATERSPASA